MQADTVFSVEREWTRPYRPGLVCQVLWWFDVLFAPPMAAGGAILAIGGIALGELSLALFGAFIALFATIVFVGAWRLIHLGVWTGPDGVEIRTLMRPAQCFPWSAVERFEVQPGESVLPLIRPASQVAIVVRENPPVLVPGLWRWSPFTWGGVGPTRIVDELESRRPGALAPS